MSLAKQWELLKSGHATALENIYRETVDQLIDYGSRFVEDRQLVEDAVHDTFVSIWKNRKTISQTEHPLAYLMLSIKRDIIRKAGKVKRLDGKQEIEESDFQVTVSIEEMLIANESNAEKHRLLKHAFDQLSNRQKEAIYLKYYQNKSYEELGKILDMNYQSVRNLVFRALTRLRKGMVSLILFVFL